MYRLLIIFLSLYWLALFHQVSPVWSADEQYGYGWFVPLLGAALLWRRWKERADAPPSQTQQCETQEPAVGLATLSGPGGFFNGVRSGTGSEASIPALTLLGICFALALLLPIRVLETVSRQWPMLLWLHAFIVLGLSFWALWVAGGSSTLRRYAFPLCFFLVALPWPGRVNQWATLGLMRGVTSVTAELAGLLGIPSIQHGNVLEIANGSVGIEEACSGIRSLQTSIMLALLLGELFRLRPAKRVILFPAGAFVALLANLGRTLFLVWCAARRGFEAMHAWHDTAGLAVVGVVMGSICLLAWLWRERPGEQPAKPQVSQPPAAIAPPGLGASSPQVMGSGLSRGFPSALMVAWCLWVPAVEGLNWVWYHWPGKGEVPAPAWSVRWPTNEPAFREIRIPEASVEWLRCTAQRQVDWFDHQGNEWNLIYLYWPPRRDLETYVGRHNPEGCFGSTGWTLLNRFPVVEVHQAGFSMFFTHRLFQRGSETMHLFHGTWQPMVPPTGQTLFYDSNYTHPLKSYFRHALERRRMLGGTTLEMGLSGSFSAEQAKRLFQQQMSELIVSKR